ncbi:conjugative transfer protein MobI(A/C) [Alcaligenes faecalis]|uniref:conjugative transfer protein MobI(A/C) n=2 Tax=Pseudomonadota TaxID=1224 RepID=UPI003CD0DDCC
MLLADITERGNQLTLTWYWDYSNLHDGKRSPSRPTLFPPLPPSVFRYPKSRFQKLDEPIRSRVMGVEAKFSSLRKRYAKLSNIRRMLVSYKGSIERLLARELTLDTQEPS